MCRVDKVGLAECAGVEVGDQLVQVNKQRLDNTTHSAAVQLLRSSKQLVLTLWVGTYTLKFWTGHSHFSSINPFTFSLSMCLNYDFVIVLLFCLFI